VIFGFLTNDTQEKKLFDMLSLDDTLLRKPMWIHISRRSQEAAAHNKHGNHGHRIIINPALSGNQTEKSKRTGINKSQEAKTTQSSPPDQA
jgi:hypothetical protein